MRGWINKKVKSKKKQRKFLHNLEDYESGRVLTFIKMYDALCKQLTAKIK